MNDLCQKNKLAATLSLAKDKFFMLWEILIPNPVITAWSDRVISLTSGLTLYSPAYGSWTSKNGSIIVEQIVPARIACSEKEIRTIADFTAQMYKQEAVMYYCVSDYAVIRTYK